ncbi:tRNA (uracil(54)-C(5))-methyltransferase like protein [Tritrichomonas foetus]|uniref:tRNA (Uracil(54)-C(5))-methyltransferase like protein n=1 Tax=Tritrichomonas foetus TaxID=1144522 RepID=A0A1J4JXI5_9EUKA|nr:tRNA (uracil(54)-C(5))-methyltransferase like protein [Tritrichomonas foetus]|eukprot:OHT01989.1 tRNA (uracil(54)-C(5))-methyltransferase like protein [Tritrichomonas foetus]
MGSIFSTPVQPEQPKPRSQPPPRKQIEQRPQRSLNDRKSAPKPQIVINKKFVPETVPDPTPDEHCGLFVDGLNFHWEKEKFAKFLTSKGITFTQAFKKKSKCFGTIHFDNNADRSEAYKILTSQPIQNRVIFVVPLRKKLEVSQRLCDRLRARATSDLDVRDIDDKITPWHNFTYEEQLQKKSEKFTNIISPILPNNDLITVFPAPKTTGYRNKVELTIGKDLKGEICVGFNLGSRVEDVIAPVKSLINCPPRTPELAEKLRKFIVDSGVPVFDRCENVGQWKFVLIRSNEKGEIMMQVVVYQTVGEKVINDLKEAFQNEVTSLYYCETDVFEAYGKNPKIIHLSGPEHIVETLRGLQFDISPMSFFQTNTPGAELLFTKIEELAEVDSNTVLIDVCCGTGVIGLSLARKVKTLIGVDIEEQAIFDARRNAEKNGILNAEFIAAKAEDALPEIIQRFSGTGSKIIAICDPPRCGLHKKALMPLRNCPGLNRLVYISCNAESLVQDAQRVLVSNGNFSSRPFVPKVWFGVDMFPHTDRCEIVMLMER